MVERRHKEMGKNKKETLEKVSNKKDRTILKLIQIRKNKS